MDWVPVWKSLELNFLPRCFIVLSVMFFTLSGALGWRLTFVESLIRPFFNSRPRDARTQTAPEWARRFISHLWTRSFSVGRRCCVCQTPENEFIFLSNSHTDPFSLCAFLFNCFPVDSKRVCLQVEPIVFSVSFPCHKICCTCFWNTPSSDNSLRRLHFYVILKNLFQYQFPVLFALRIRRSSLVCLLYF